MALHLFHQYPLLPLIHLLHRLEHQHLGRVSAHADHGANVFGETRAAIADTGKDEMRTDATIQSNGLPHSRYVSAGLLVQARIVVDERNFPREDSVGGS